MKILEVVPVFSEPFGGPVTIVRLISKELAKRHDVTVYTTTALDKHHDSNPRSEMVDGYKVNYFKRDLKRLSYSNLLGQVNLSFSLAQALKEQIRNFDVVHVHSWQQFPDVAVCHYAKKNNVPYILQVHGSLQPVVAKQSLKKAFNLLFGYNILNNASGVVALTKLEANQYFNMGVSSSNINIIPNAFELSDYATLPAKGSFKRKYGINKNEKIILYLGRIHESKGLDLLAQSFGYIAQKFPNARLVLVGPDDGYAKIVSNLISNNGFLNKVLFTGFIDQDQKLAALIDSEVLITPKFYGFPMTFLEACLAHCPIITTYNSLDWIHNNVGFVVDDSAISIAKATGQILESDVLRAQLSEKCAATIKNFDITVVSRMFEKVYDSAIRNCKTIA